MTFSDYKQTENELTDKIEAAIQKGNLFIEDLYFNSMGSKYCGSLVDGRVWDTALLSISLIESGYPEEKLKRTGNFLIKKQVLSGGFPYGHDFEHAPDCDNTSEVIISLSKIGGFRKNIDKAINWLKTMQNKDGGWGAFDRDNHGNFILKFAGKKFEDSLDLFDESSADFLQAFSRSTPLMIASVQSHAKTSANSSSLFSFSFDAKAVASSPTSSMNHRNVASVPLCRSRFPYLLEISCWNSLMCIFSVEPMGLAFTR